MTPSWAMVATSAPCSVHTCPETKARSPFACGDESRTRSQLSASKSEQWKWTEWSREVIMPSAWVVSWGQYAVQRNCRSDMKARAAVWCRGSSPRACPALVLSQRIQQRVHWRFTGRVCQHMEAMPSALESCHAGMIPGLHRCGPGTSGIFSPCKGAGATVCPPGALAARRPTMAATTRAPVATSVARTSTRENERPLRIVRTA
mmetsp:Transcript_2635/g.8683  ORF Transcript_2635/g.8683 Transcript_2635/m.8683 type:complete len:204 (+) Transcript_2635:410-1021(+)